MSERLDPAIEPRPSQQGSDVALAILLALNKLRVPLSFEVLVSVTGHRGIAVSAALTGLLERQRIQRTGSYGAYLYHLPRRT